MKKYLFGLAAIVFALGVVAFTSPDLGKRANVTLFYQSSSFAQTDVQTQANWKATSKTCISGTDKACKFDIDENYTKVVGGIRQLKVPGDAAPVLTISAELGTGGSNYRIPPAHANLSSVVNKN